MAKEEVEAPHPDETRISYDKVREVFARGESIRHGEMIHTEMSTLAPFLHEFSATSGAKDRYADELEESIAQKQAELEALRKDRRSARQIEKVDKTVEKTEAKTQEPEANAPAAPAVPVAPKKVEKPAAKIEAYPAVTKSLAPGGVAYQKLKVEAAQHGFLFFKNPNPKADDLREWIAAHPKLDPEAPAAKADENAPLPTIQPNEIRKEGAE